MLSTPMTEWFQKFLSWPRECGEKVCDKTPTSFTPFFSEYYLKTINTIGQFFYFQ